MLIPNKFNGYVAGRRTYNTGMEPILLGAAIGGGTSALRGGNPLQGALLGGLTGGVGNYAMTGTLPSFLGSAASAAPVTAALPSSIVEGAAATGLNAAAPAAAETAAINMGSVSPAAALPPQGLNALMMNPEVAGALPDTFAQAAMNPAAAPAPAPAPAIEAAAAPAAAGQAPAASNLSFMGTQQPAAGFRTSYGAFDQAAKQAPKGLMELWKSLPPEKKLLYGGGGMLGLMALMNQKPRAPGATPYTGPLSKFVYDPSVYRPQFAQGGIADLGSYSDGGRLLKGPGDGMSDNIPATIANKQPARLADGEFVIPADVVSHLGNGSTDAGAKQLYAMMDRIRAARTGTKKQGKQINPERFMPTRTKRKAKRFNSGGPSADGPAVGDSGAINGFSSAGIDAALGMHGLSSNSGYGGPDTVASYGQGIDSLLRPEILADYKPQQQPSVNTNIYRPTYTNYAKSSTPAISDYGINTPSPFGEFVDPFAQAQSQAPVQRGIGGRYPAFDDYGLAGLNR